MTERLILALFLFALVPLSNSFIFRRSPVRVSRITMSDGNKSASAAAAAMVKKGKMKVIHQLRKDIEEQGDGHLITKYLKEGCRPTGVSEPVDFYTRVVPKADGVGMLSILVEYNKKIKTGFLIGMPPPEIMGGVLRDAGAKAIVCSMDPRTGGVTSDEFYRFTKEQSSARIFIPPPISIIWNDLVIDKIQIAHASALGAAAITLQPAFTSREDFKEQVEYCKLLKVEPIAMAENIDDANFAISNGVRCLCLNNLDEVGLLELRSRLPNDPSIQIGARFRWESQYSSYNEIDSAWMLRDHGFSSLWPSAESIFSSGMTDIYPTITAMKSKASRVYISPRQFVIDRKDEGAKEYLGDILY